MHPCNDVFALPSQDKNKKSPDAHPEILFRISFISRYNVPLNSCSRSIASNNALKLPLPKLFAPWRSMIS